MTPPRGAFVRPSPAAGTLSAVVAPILLVEDDGETADVCRAYLEKEGFAVVVCRHGDRALDVARQTAPRLLVLDVMLPGRDGFEICREIRQRGSTVPILMLTARADEVDRILGLRIGADDYLVKPFSPRELVARVQALLRRAEIAPQPPVVLSLADLELAVDRHEARVGGAPVEVTHFEFSLLATLLEQPGRVYTRSQLLAGVYGSDDVAVLDRTIDVHVARIRDKLEQLRSRATIGTVRGVGYKITAEPAASASAG